MRILLVEDDFIKLTRGEIIKYADSQIALSDIGYNRMIEIIEKNKIEFLKNQE